MNSITTTAPIAGTLPAAGTASSRRLPGKKLLGVGLAAAVAAAAIGGYVHHVAGFETTDNAFIEGNVHPVSARINGTVARVLVDDNAHVNAGDPLVELDSADQRLAVLAAEADLAQARAVASQVTAQASKAGADVAAAGARIEQNAAQLRRTELDYNRAVTLAGGTVQAMSQQDLDAARAAFAAASAGRQSLLAERTAAEAALAAVDAQRAVVQAQIQKAEAALAAARLQVDYTVIRAAVSGRVAKKSVETGQRLQPGQPVMSLVSDEVWVVANFKENQLAHLKAGARVDIRVDAVEGRIFHGVIDSFSPGTGSKFSLLPPDNATGNFTKVVQRVPVKILLSDEQTGAEGHRLAPGLSAVVKAATRD